MVYSNRAHKIVSVQESSTRINWNLNVYNLAILYMYRFEEKLIPHTILKKKPSCK